MLRKHRVISSILIDSTQRGLCHPRPLAVVITYLQYKTFFA